MVIQTVNRCKLLTESGGFRTLLFVECLKNRTLRQVETTKKGEITVNSRVKIPLAIPARHGRIKRPNRQLDASEFSMKYRKTIKKWLAFCVAFLILIAAVPPVSAQEQSETDNTEIPDAADAENSADGVHSDVPDDWETRLLLMLQERNANPETIGAGYYNFITGETHFYNADQYRVSGSMYKVPLNMLFLNWIDEGKIALDESISGYRYSQLLEGTIIDSNNDYAKILWDYAGATIETNPASTLYHRYRILIAPLMGEDPDNVDAKYYENNFFTPRQMITCLRALYDGGEKYSRLIETMQRAEPEKYFKLHEQRFNIAHKYGWYAEDPILYLNDCAICYTDDPIAIVLFTTGTENAYGVMADFCTLMCDYAQEKHAERIAREEEEAAAAAEKAAAERARIAEEAAKTEQQPEQNVAEQIQYMPEEQNRKADETPGDESRTPAYQLKTGHIVSLACIMAALLGATVWFALRHRKGGLNLLYGLLSVLFAVAAVLVCFPGMENRSYIAVPEENAQNVVVRFFNSMRNGEYETAEKCLAPGGQLGFGTAVSSDAHSAVLQALEESWDYNLLGECTVDKARAWQEMQLQVLDYSKMESDLQRETRVQLLALSREQSRNAVYDEEGNYRPEVASAAYDRALISLLEEPQVYYRSIGLRVELTLTRDGWKITPTRELFAALSGTA